MTPYIYSGAVLELVDEPIILIAPDILDRYWSIEVADTFLENRFYIGSRATDRVSSRIFCLGGGGRLCAKINNYCV